MGGLRNLGSSPFGADAAIYIVYLVLTGRRPAVSFIIDARQDRATAVFTVARLANPQAAVDRARAVLAELSQVGRPFFPRQRAPLAPLLGPNKCFVLPQAAETFQIKPKFRSQSRWAAAVAALGQLDRQLLPSDLLAVLEQWKVAVYTTVEEEIGPGTIVAGDDLLGIVVWCVVQCKASDLSLAVEMMLRFATGGEQEYFCTTMLAALQHILDAVKRHSTRLELAKCREEAKENMADDHGGGDGGGGGGGALAAPTEEGEDRLRTGEQLKRGHASSAVDAAAVDAPSTALTAGPVENDRGGGGGGGGGGSDDGAGPSGGSGRAQDGTCGGGQERVGNSGGLVGEPEAVESIERTLSIGPNRHDLFIGGEL